MYCARTISRNIRKLSKLISILPGLEANFPKKLHLPVPNESGKSLGDAVEHRVEFYEPSYREQMKLRTIEF